MGKAGQGDISFSFYSFSLLFDYHVQILTMLKTLTNKIEILCSQTSQEK